MTDHYAAERDARTEGAALSTRLGDGSKQSAIKRAEPSAIADIRGRAEVLIERAARLSAQLKALGNRAFGELPERDASSRPDEAPQYGGEMAEMYYTINRISRFMDEAEQAAARLDSIA